MVEISASELFLIRHGPTDMPGHLCGRTDAGLAANVTFPQKFALGRVTSIWTSPAVRARDTAKGLWPGRNCRHDARLWEQDFGDWDGLAYADVPDMGELSGNALADLAAPGGESFRDVVTRVRPAIRAAADDALATGPVAIVAHAGVIRAALAVAMEDVAAALAFEVDHLSVTRLRCLPGGALTIISVNGALK